MQVNDEALLRSGFTPAELDYIKKRMESYEAEDGEAPFELEEAITILSNKFRAFLWVNSVLILYFIYAMLTKDKADVVAFGISALFTFPITTFVILPPILSYKSWRYWRKHRKT
jgi:hypothetical protein